MTIPPLIELATVIVLGALAQWMGWLLRLPSILLLLLFGFLAGPVANIVRPDELFGDLLMPLVSASVALILFEGGLTLNISDLRRGGGVVLMLVTVGAVISGVLSAVAAYWLCGLDFGLSVLLGAILTVTGPTVVLPLLRHIRPAGPVNAILRWEGIVIDPIGAVLALIAFEVVSEGSYHHALPHAMLTVARTLLMGGAAGLLGAGLLVLVIRRYWAPDRLHTLIAVTLVTGVFAGSNWLLHESGLMAVTVMGIALANQRVVDLRPIHEFKENLGVFLLSILFVLLSARVRLADIANVGAGALLFLAALALVIRPLSVFVSTLGSKLTWRERLFIAWMAPRGIIAAAVTSVFALALEQRGHEQARLLVPIIFTTIVGTVLIYGLTAGPLARRLKLAHPNPQGLLLLGAGPFARELARVAQANGVATLLVDTNLNNVSTARMAGLNTHYGSILAEDTLQAIDLAGIGQLLALTSNDEVNSLATQRFVHLFGRASLFQIPPKGSESGRSKMGSEFHGRLLFRKDATLAHLADMMSRGASVRATKLTPEFKFEQFRERYGGSAIPLLALGENGKVTVMTADDKVEPRPGQTLVSLALPAAMERPEAAVAPEAQASPSREAQAGTPPVPAT